ncbi:MAG: hypothetical protein FJZ49_01260 [Candidatus Verstraetearchaeota archaeon]|nr:hypothetical protein [Candidatus Verstraetearchaeota archaeon]
MAYVGKTARSIRESWSVIGRSPIFYYSGLSIVAMYVATYNYMAIVDLIGQGLEPFFLGAFFTCTIVSLIIGAFFHEKLRLKGHLIWNLLGVIFGIMLILPISGLYGLVLYSILGGLSVGFCVPSVITRIVNKTNYENRGSVSGVFIAIIYVLIIGCSLSITTTVQMGILLCLIKLISTFLVFKIDFMKSTPVESPFVKYGAGVKVAFCFIWFTFLLVNAITSAIGTKLVLGNEFVILNITTLVIGLVSMTLGGVLMDEIGRKKMLIFCYAYLGLEYAMVSLSGGFLIRYTFLDGIAWGILTVYFIMVLVGDIIVPKMRPFFVSVIMALAILGLYSRSILYTEETVIQMEQIFPLTSVFLFVAVFVILLLPETLPDKVMQKKELQNYLQRAKKVKEKYR